MLDESWTTILYKTNNDYNNISITKVDIDKEMIIPNELINFNISLQNNSGAPSYCLLPPWQLLLLHEVFFESRNRDNVCGSCVRNS